LLPARRCPAVHPGLDLEHLCVGKRIDPDDHNDAALDREDIAAAHRDQVWPHRSAGRKYRPRCPAEHALPRIVPPKTDVAVTHHYVALQRDGWKVATENNQVIVIAHLALELEKLARGLL
jgi:hypothetical protein